jgi:hypothetical protein
VRIAHLRRPQALTLDHTQLNKGLSRKSCTKKLKAKTAKESLNHVVKATSDREETLEIRRPPSEIISRPRSTVKVTVRVLV